MRLSKKGFQPPHSMIAQDATSLAFALVTTLASLNIRSDNLLVVLRHMEYSHVFVPVLANRGVCSAGGVQNYPCCVTDPPQLRPK